MTDAPRNILTRVPPSHPGLDQPIDDQLLSGSQATFSFPSIPTVYRSLELVVLARADAGTTVNMLMQFNQDATVANYITEYVLGAAAGASAATITTFAGIFPTNVPGSVVAAGHAALARILIPDFQDTTFYKRALCESGFFTNNHGCLLASGLWLNTAAINRIGLSLIGANFVTGSRATLLGRY